MASTTDSEEAVPNGAPAGPPRLVDKDLLWSARRPFGIALAAVGGILAIFGAQMWLGKDWGLLWPINPTDSAFVRFLIPSSLYLILFLVAVLATYIGYRVIVAAGATTTPVIPSQDYPLLAPLISKGQADAIDQYVRLSSLTKFTGTFTQLGLTGLPLATIFLTLLFAALTLVNSADFLDLTKLTLGAFIGSFVQRQVERRGEAGGAKDTIAESRTPPSAR